MTEPALHERNAPRIERSVEIEAPPERVWGAVTQARHLGNWFGDAGAEVELVPGGRLVLHWTEHGTALGEVLEVDPPRLFAFRWSLVPDQGPRPGNQTFVRFTLEPLGPSRTRLTVVETGFETLDGSEAERNRHLDANRSGWRAELSELAAYLAPVAGAPSSPPAP
jgi:uncharacterized protein YndB with AHSA1/START domain